MASDTYQDTYEITLFIETCVNCGITFGIPKTYERKLRQTHDTFYCPNGHSLYYYGKSNEEKLRDRLKREQESREWAEREATREAQRRQKAEYKARAAKGQVTKIKNRIGRGVCPCCNRTFENLARHMQSKHPEYSGE